MTRARGIDISFFQKRPDLTKITAADAIAFCIVKCAEGVSAVDPDFAHNVASVRATGRVPGCYNFAHPLPGNDPRVQAQHHHTSSGGLGSNPGELPPALDFESPDPTAWAEFGCSAAQLNDWAAAYQDEALQLWGCNPIFYTYRFFLQPFAQGLASSPLWIADYDHPGGWPAETDAPHVPAPWAPAWAIWQTSGGSFYRLANGTMCDTNVFLGDEAALAAFCAGSRV